MGPESGRPSSSRGALCSACSAIIARVNPAPRRCSAFPGGSGWQAQSMPPTNGPHSSGGRLPRGPRGRRAFLGGEPLLQPEFLAEVIDRVLLGPSGYASGEDWRRVVGHANLLFLDLKLIERPTGVTRGRQRLDPAKPADDERNGLVICRPGFHGTGGYRHR
jgi:hypothetical protein